MSERVVKYVLIGGLYVVGGVIIKKLNDIQAEIEYFEDCKDVGRTRKQYEAYVQEYFSSREGEA